MIIHSYGLNFRSNSGIYIAKRLDETSLCFENISKTASYLIPLNHPTFYGLLT